MAKFFLLVMASLTKFLIGMGHYPDPPRWMVGVYHWINQVWEVASYMYPYQITGQLKMSQKLMHHCLFHMNHNYGKCIVCITNCQRDHAMKVLVVIVGRTTFFRTFNTKMLTINCTYAVREIPFLFKPFSYIYPVIMTWKSFQVVITQRTSNSFTSFLYYFKYCWMINSEAKRLRLLRVTSS